MVCLPLTQFLWQPWAAHFILAVALCASRRLRPANALLVGFAWSHAYALMTVPTHLPGDEKVLRLQLSGRVLLTTVNTDEQKQLVRDYEVHSLPFCKLFQRLSLKHLDY